MHPDCSPRAGLPTLGYLTAKLGPKLAPKKSIPKNTVNEILLCNDFTSTGKYWREEKEQWMIW